MRRVFNSSPQSIPCFVGWVIQAFGRLHSKMTMITFLPPILHPITQYNTVIECIKQSQKFASASNMKFTHITVDGGAAMKFFHVVWNNPDEFSIVLIHLGDFHAMMEFFSTIGKFVACSGFEEVVYQAGLCTSGGIKGVLSGKHYNRSWMVHESFAEAIDRLFCEAFLPEITKDLEHVVKRNVSEQIIDDVIETIPFTDYEQRYESLKSRCLRGEFGKTPQFWMTYQKAIDRQHKFHFSINTNDFDLRLKRWKDSLPLCSVTNKQNYARYGTYYITQLENIDLTHPGAKEELQEMGLSVSRNQFNIRQSIDGAGEQTFMRSSKTTGGVKSFVHQQNTYEKWVLNRLFQAKMVQSMLSLADINEISSNPRKRLRDHEIRKSEDRVRRIAIVLKEDIVNPLSDLPNKRNLYNLASGRPLPEEATEHLLSLEKQGQGLLSDFSKRLYLSEEQTSAFFDPITRVPWKGFCNAEKKAKITAKGKLKMLLFRETFLVF